MPSGKTFAGPSSKTSSSKPSNRASSDNTLDDETILAYHRRRTMCIVVGSILVIVAFFLILGTVGLGAMSVPYRDVLKIITGSATGHREWMDGIKSNAVAVVWEMRLPRIVCGIAVGAGLATAGVIFQAILQNPLADPYTLGVSTGAAFGASLTILVNVLFGLTVPTLPAALLGALMTLLVVIVISLRGGGMMRSNLIIAGIIVSSILSAGISFMKMMAGDNVSAIIFWLMGSLSARDWSDAILVSVIVLGGVMVALIFGSNLNVMTLGAQQAESLGVNVTRTRLLFLVLGSTITAVCVSVCGIIGFIGLIVPHLLRISLTSDNRILIILSVLAGGVLLSIADTSARLISSGEVPVGVLTTLLGGPFFIAVFLRRQGGIVHDE